MCGIFGYIGKRQNVAEIILSGLKTLEYRGYDSWGVAVVSENGDRSKIVIKKKAGKIGDATVSELPKSQISFGHTRWATHGGVTDLNAHPHTDCTQQFAIIHNGIIENYDEIKKELLKKGHHFISETDTEVAVHLIEEIYKNLSKKKRVKKEFIFQESVRLAFNQFEGLNAIIVMDALSQTLVAAKNGSPLAIGKGRDENFLASDAHAMSPYTKKVYFMNDGEVIVISKNDIYVISAKTGTSVPITFTTLSLEMSVASKRGFPHYMLKEIYDQPEVMEKIIKQDKKVIKQFAYLIKSSYGAYLVGCGTAAYACLAGTYLFSKIAKRHVNFSVGSEFGYLIDFLTTKSLVIALSQSGETIDVIETVKKAKDKGAKIASLVNVSGSTLSRLSDSSFPLSAGAEIAVVSTKAFTAKLTYLLLVAHEIDNSNKEGYKEVELAISATAKILREEYIQKIKELSKSLANHKHIYVIGRGLSYPIALETALKIKEASYIHAEGFAAGELKHGVIALIEKGTPCIAFLPNDETYGANLAGAMEMKARGGKIFGISFKSHEIFDEYFPVDDCNSASIIPSVVVGQLLGYYLALERGLDPDMPRNLAKSVTVK